MENAPLVSSFEAMNFSFPESIGEPSISLVLSATILDVPALFFTGGCGSTVCASDNDATRISTPQARNDNNVFIRHLLSTLLGAPHTLCLNFNHAKRQSAKLASASPAPRSGSMVSSRIETPLRSIA